MFSCGWLWSSIFSRQQRKSHCSAAAIRRNPESNPCAVQLHRFAPQSRANSCAILSLVETIIARSEFSSVRAISRSREYHYSSINAERRNSENICTNCGNPALSISAHFRMLLISKHLELFQNGPPLANRVATRLST